MGNLKDSVQDELEKMWPQAKKNISKANKDFTKFVKKSEKKLIDIYGQAKKKTDELIARAKREELYYELGKALASHLTSDQLKKKNILKIWTQLRQLNKKLRIRK